MAWVSVVVLAVTVVLTIGAWRFRGKPRRPLAEPRTDRVDRWLIQQYGLASLRDCWDVRDAVRGGRAVGDPALREAAHGLAAELLSGRLRDANPIALVMAGLFALAGTLYLGTGLTRGGGEATLYIFAGAMSLLAACAWVWRSARFSRR